MSVLTVSALYHSLVTAQTCCIVMEPSLILAVNKAPIYSHSFPEFLFSHILFWRTRFRNLPTTSRGRFKIQFYSTANTFIIQILGWIGIAYSVLTSVVTQFWKKNSIFKLVTSNVVSNVYVQNKSFHLNGVLGRTAVWLCFETAKCILCHNSHCKKYFMVMCKTERQTLNVLTISPFSFTTSTLWFSFTLQWL